MSGSEQFKPVLLNVNPISRSVVPEKNKHTVQLKAAGRVKHFARAVGRWVFRRRRWKSLDVGVSLGFERGIWICSEGGHGLLPWSSARVRGANSFAAAKEHKVKTRTRQSNSAGVVRICNFKAYFDYDRFETSQPCRGPHHSIPVEPLLWETPTPSQLKSLV